MVSYWLVRSQYKHKKTYQYIDPTYSKSFSTIQPTNYRWERGASLINHQNQKSGRESRESHSMPWLILIF